jgi:hypothetical protein
MNNLGHDTYVMMGAVVSPPLDVSGAMAGAVEVDD